MIRMKALGYQKYEGVAYRAGDIIPVKNETDASDMVTLRLAQRIPVAAVLAPAASYESRAVVAGPAEGEAGGEAEATDPPKRSEPAAPVESKAAKKSGRYGHREMRVGR